MIPDCASPGPPDEHARGDVGDVAAPPQRRSVIVFRKRLLPWSETFVAAQARALQRYRPVFAGYSWEQAGASYLDGSAHAVLSDCELLPGISIGKGLLKAFDYVPRRWLRALRAHHPALVHAHFFTSARPAAALARALDVPLVVTFHGHDIAPPPRDAAHARARQRQFEHIEVAIAVSAFIAGRVQDAGCPPAKIRIHHIGVDTDRFTPADATVAGRVLFVGRLTPKKGLVHLLRALPAVQQRVPHAHVVIAGDGPLRAEMESLAQELGVHAQFLGVQTPDQVRTLMREAAVLAAPSVVTRSGNAEGLPITMMEALASGLPAVAFPSGGSPDAVRNGETGLLVPAANEAALAEALTSILGDDARRARMAAAARAFALESFSLRRQTDALERIYDEVTRR